MVSSSLSHSIEESLPSILYVSPPPSIFVSTISLASASASASASRTASASASRTASGTASSLLIATMLASGTVSGKTSASYKSDISLNSISHCEFRSSSLTTCSFSNSISSSS